MGIFDKRVAYKPFEYKGAIDFANQIIKCHWVHNEIVFNADKQDFICNVLPHEQTAVKRSLLAIAQIEVNVKSFWGKLYDHLPKPEFNGMGATFAESEFRHSEAYSRLISLLGFDDDFIKLTETPCIKNRIHYLTEALQNSNSKDPKEYILTLILFTILIENVSLFSQFATILSITRFRGYLKNIANIVAWTSIDEQIHANAGIYIINEIIEEFPEFLTKELKEKITTVIKKSISAEASILDWVFEEGEFKQFGKIDLLNFMKNRVDESITQIGLSPIYNVSEAEIDPMFWFYEEMYAPRNADFFAHRPVEYTKNNLDEKGQEVFTDELNQHLKSVGLR